MIKAAILLQTISIWVIILPLVAGVFAFNRLNRASTIIFFLVVTATLPQLLSFYLQEEDPTLHLSYNLYIPVEYSVVALLFYQKLTNRKIRLALKVVSFLFGLTCIYLFAEVDLFKRYINELTCISNLIYIFFLLSYLRQLLYTETAISLKDSFFYYFLGFMIYAPCTAVVISFYYYIKSGRLSFHYLLWNIHSLCNILMYILFTIGFFYDYRGSKTTATVSKN